MTKMSFITMTVDTEAREEIFSFAEARGVSASALMREALRSLGVNIPTVRPPGRPHRPLAATPIPTPPRVRTRSAVPTACEA
jgi:hypothetical protein